jgi:hypothetical protein
MVRDVLDVAGRDPWSFPPFNTRDPEGEDVRTASVGQLTAVYWINRPAGRLCVVDIVWLGRPASDMTRPVTGIVVPVTGRCASAVLPGQAEREVLVEDRDEEHGPQRRDHQDGVRLVRPHRGDQFARFPAPAAGLGEGLPLCLAHLRGQLLILALPLRITLMVCSPTTAPPCLTVSSSSA